MVRKGAEDNIARHESYFCPALPPAGLFPPRFQFQAWESAKGGMAEQNIISYFNFCDLVHLLIPTALAKTHGA